MPDPETDIIVSRANVALARSQRLVASWLSLSPASGAAADDAAQPAPKTEEELQREERELFTAVPETLGVGAPLPTKLPDGSWNRAELDSNDALRRQLLGRNYQRVMKEKAQQQQSQPQGAGAGKGTGELNSDVAEAEVVGEDGDEEEDGRTAAIGRKNGQRQGLSRNQKKRSKKRKAAEEQTERVPAGDPDGDTQGQDKQGEKQSEEEGQDKSDNLPSRPARKKATSFLDEILAERSKKRKKR